MVLRCLIVRRGLWVLALRSTLIRLLLVLTELLLLLGLKRMMLVDRLLLTCVRRMNRTNLRLLRLDRTLLHELRRERSGRNYLRRSTLGL